MSRHLHRHSSVHIRPSHHYAYWEPECYCDGVPCECPDTGALERQNPLPVGTYSVDLKNDQVPIFRNWQQGRSAVKVLKTNDDGEFSWILFSVSAPTIWAQGIGFPSIAKTTDEKPAAFDPTKDPTDQIADALPSLAAFAIPSYLLTTAGIGLALYLFRKDIFDYGKRSVRKLRDSRRSRSGGA